MEGQESLMSETASNGFTLIAFLIGLLPGIYFAYRIIREVVYYFTGNDEDIL